jgi:glutamyl-tRNA reductase
MALPVDAAPPGVRSLLDWADAICESELQRLYARCPGLSERQRLLIASMSAALVQRLLHDAISKICDKAAVDRAQALREAHVLSELFDVR